MWDKNIRQKSSEQAPQPVLEEPFGFPDKIQIKPIAIEFDNSTGSHYDTLGVTVFNNVQREQESINKNGCQSVVRR